MSKDFNSTEETYEATTSVINLKQRLLNSSNELFDAYISNKLIYSIIYEKYPETLIEVLFHVTSADLTKVNYKLETRTDFTKVIHYRGTPLYFRNKVEKTKVTRIKIYTINTKRNITNLNEFLNKVDMIVNKHNMEFVKNTIVTVDTYARYINHKKRTFDDVFITNSQKVEIISCLDSFISRQDWYKCHNIPYHFGIILHGVPGCGKTALAQAIADYANSLLFSLNGDELRNLDKMIDEVKFRNKNNKERSSTLLIDDIDCAEITKDRSKKSSQTINLVDDNIGTASLLNSFDGIDSPENIIYIFTTNHIDKLDPALIRPGRIDLSIELGYVCYETMNQFFNKHYGVDFPETSLILDGLTFAKLQTYVMKGMTPEEFIKATTHEYKSLAMTYDGDYNVKINYDMINQNAPEDDNQIDGAEIINDQVIC